MERWQWQDGTTSEDSLTAATLDPLDGSTVLGGFTYGNWSGTNLGLSDWTAAKLSSNGSVLWTRQGGGAGEDTVVGAVFARDSSALLALSVPTNVSMAATAAASSNISTAPGDTPVSSSSPFFFSLLKLDADGNDVWEWKDDQGGMEYATAVEVDGEGGIVVAGETFGDYGASNLGRSDFACVKLKDSTNASSAGATVQWRWQGGTNGFDVVRAVAFGEKNSVILAGWTTGSFAALNAGGKDMVAVGLDGETGDQLWAWQGGTLNDDSIEAVTAQRSGEDGLVILAGTSFGNWNRDQPDLAFSSDMVAVWLVGSGTEIARWQNGTTEDDTLQAAVLQDDGTLVLSGSSGGRLLAVKLSDVAESAANGTRQLWRWEGGSNSEDPTAPERVSTCGAGVDGQSVIGGFTFSKNNTASLFFAQSLGVGVSELPGDVPREFPPPSSGSTPTVVIAVATALAVGIALLGLLERWLKKKPRTGRRVSSELTRQM